MTVMADNKFAPLAELMYDLPGAPTLNLTSANEHEPVIERRIRVVKERVRAVRHLLPFNSIPVKMLTHMVFFVVKMLNYFPAKGGISTQYSPKTIMSGHMLNYKQCSLPFGTYCQVHKEEGPRNSLAARTQGAISLGPSSNTQGGQLFFSLNTGRVLLRRGYTVLPMPSGVIDRVNTLAADQPRLLTFADRDGNAISNDTTEITLPDTPHKIPGVIGDVATIPGVDMEDGNKVDTSDKDQDNIPTMPPLTPDAEDVEQTTEFEAQQTEQVEPIKQPVMESAVAPSTKTAPKPPTAKKVTIQMGTRTSSRIKKQTQAYAPSMKGKLYEYTATQFKDTTFDERIVEYILTQLTLKAAIKTWGDKARIAAEAEMKQLHWRNSFKPVRWNDLTEQQKKSILESHIFMKLKQSGEIKGRTVAGGNKQRGLSVIDAEENRQTAVVDVPNAFIQTVVTDEKKRVIIRIRGMLVDILVKIAPDIYQDYVTTDRKENKQILVECLNALYGTMVAALLYYQKFTNSLKEKGYNVNPYDPCVWNKKIKGSQCTICFHVDDCKISHKSKTVVDQTIKWLRKDYESIFEDGSGKMKINRGKVHKYLGMTLDFSTKNQVKISMIEYVKDIISTWDKNAKLSDDGFTVVKRGKKGRATAALEDLFKIDEDSPKLKLEAATVFHNIVAKALYLVKRARPDASVSVAFLTTRVRSPDEDDWRKLEHLIHYFKSTTEMPLILGGNSSGVLKWYVDASFAVHLNMRGHTGGGLTMGRGFPIVTSTKQKLNTRSSTESELVGVMPSILWTRYFLEAQGYQVKDNVIFQDNKSTMLLERNGKLSSSKRTKHIKVRYFFITDRISKGEVRVEWCPTKEMVADFMTKPLQGALFKKFRDLIMGALPIEEVNKVLKHDKITESSRDCMAHE